MHSFFHGLKRPIHISHRGGALVAPENTLFSFNVCVREHTTDVLEIDLHQTRDGVLVVSHDPTVDRCTNGAGAIADLTLTEVQKLDAAHHWPKLRGTGISIPTFEAALNAFPDVRFNIDVKDARCAERTIDFVRNHPALPKLCLGSEDDEVAALFARELPTALLFFPKNALITFVLTTMNGETVDDDRFQVLDMPLTWEGNQVFDRRVAQAAHERGKWVNVWTLNTREEMELALNEGCDGVMTDRPDVLRQVLDTTQRK